MYKRSFFIFIAIFFISNPSPIIAQITTGLSHTHAYAYFMEAIIEKARGNFDMAEKALKEALKREPNEVYILKELAEVAIHRNNLEEATHWAKEVLSLAPDDVDTMILLARIYMQEKKVPQAIELLERVLEKDPGNRQALFYLGNLYMEIKDYAKAIETLERSSKHQSPGSFMIHYYLGRLYLDSKKLDKAEMHFKKAIELNMDVASAYYGLAQVYKEKKEVANAISAYKAYLSRRPSDLKARDELIQLLIKDKRKKEAIHEIEEFIQKGGQDPRVGLRAAGYFIDLGDYNGALEVIERLQQFYPASPQLHFYKAIAYEGLGKFDKAVAEYETIGPNDPVFILARLRISRILRGKKEYDKALKVLKEVVDNKNIPHKTQLNEVLLDMALLLDQQGKRKEAIETAKKVLEEYPDDPSALNFVGYTYADMGIKLDEAERLIKKALEKRPNDGYILDSLGWVYYKKHKYHKAIDILEKAVKAVPDDPIINEHLGDAYFANGNYEDARDQYDRASRLFKDKKDRRRVEDKRDKAQKELWELMPF